MFRPNKKADKKSPAPLLGQVLQKVAPNAGARVVLEPLWKHAGQIVFKDGRKEYFRHSSLPINSLGASEIAKDKDYANFFMKRMGYPVVPGSRAFCSPRWARAIGSDQSVDAALAHARAIGFPVMAKPNSGSQGSNVFFTHSENELEAALAAIFKKDRMALVQKPVSGNDYRVVVLDGEIISAYRRVPLSVIGDGKSSVRKLLERKQRQFIAGGRDTTLKIGDPRIKAKLSRQGLSLDSVIDRGATIFLLDNANLSTGGDSIDVTRDVHPGFARLAASVTKDMGLRLCGVDLMIDGVISDEPKKSRKGAAHWVLEINSAPGLDHYARSGKEQEKIVEDLYLKVIKALGRNKRGFK